MGIFKRITDNRISADNLKGLFDEIRMRDEDGHPLGYIEHGNFRIEFRRASLRRGCLEVDAKIYQNSRPAGVDKVSQI